MKKVINFSKGFIPCAIISFAIIIFGIAGFFIRGLNLGLDFEPGLIEEVRISEPVASVTYDGAAQISVDLSANAIDFVISGVGAVNETRSFSFDKYPTVESLASEISGIEGMNFEVLDGSYSSESMFLSSASTNVLSSSKIYFYPLTRTDANVDEIRDSLSELSSISVQELGSDENISFQIRMGVSSDSTQESLSETVNSKLAETFGEENIAVVKTDFIGSSYSSSIAFKSILMLVLTVLVIWIYAAIRFHWDFALGSIVALIHDVLIMMTFIVWTQMEFSATVLAAVLTIIGYSINATVVILDRIRYNLKFMTEAKKFNEILNQSLTDTLTRTILTTATTLITVIALFVFTTGSIKDFALALIVGLLSGAYSSMFISCGFISACRKNWKPEYGVHHSLKAVQKDNG